MVKHTSITWNHGYQCKLMKDVSNKTIVMYDPYLQLLKEKQNPKDFKRIYIFYYFIFFEGFFIPPSLRQHVTKVKVVF